MGLWSAFLELPLYIQLVPLFVIAIGAEVFSYARRHASYGWREGSASYLVFVGNVGQAVLTGGFLAWVFAGVYEHRLATISTDSAWGWLALFLAGEFFGYWQHRVSHRLRWMWASHAVHHSSTQMTFAAAARLPWTTVISGDWVFAAAIVWIGFHPAAVVLLAGLVSSYQFFIHTELVPNLGRLEWIINTPSRHRVHHATNERYLDKNFGIVTVLFDRLFGTLAEESASDPCRYGLLEPIQTHNPFKIAFFEWGRLLRDVRASRTLSGRLARLLVLPARWPAERPAARVSG